MTNSSASWVWHPFPSHGRLETAPGSRESTIGKKSKFACSNAHRVGSYRAPIEVAGIEDATVRESLDEDTFDAVLQEIELIDGVSEALDIQAVHEGKQMPVFFGSAMNNFGVQHMLERFLALAPEPTPRKSGDELIEPAREDFSGFVFKIQANMNPKHRDRAAFIRIVSGAFERDMQVTNPRTGKTMRLANSQRLFGKERETLDEALAGDILALVGNYDLLLGDTLTTNPSVRYSEMPQFMPECFAAIRNTDTANIKRFRAGLDQLLKEGVAQAYDVWGAVQKVPILGAVGPLQFEVFKYRLETEYKADCRIETAPYTMVRWVVEKNPTSATRHNPSEKPPVQLPTGCSLATDSTGNWVVLLPERWALNILQDRNEDFEFADQPDG